MRATDKITIDITEPGKGAGWVALVNTSEDNDMPARVVRDGRTWHAYAGGSDEYRGAGSSLAVALKRLAAAVGITSGRVVVAVDPGVRGKGVDLIIGTPETVVEAENKATRDAGTVRAGEEIMAFANDREHPRFHEASSAVENADMTRGEWATAGRVMTDADYAEIVIAGYEQNAGVTDATVRAVPTILPGDPSIGLAPYTLPTGYAARCELVSMCEGDDATHFVHSPEYSFGQKAACADCARYHIEHACVTHTVSILWDHGTHTGNGPIMITPYGARREAEDRAYEEREAEDTNAGGTEIDVWFLRCAELRDKTIAKLDKINARAIKMGLDGRYTYTVGEPFPFPIFDAQRLESDALAAGVRTVKGHRQTEQGGWMETDVPVIEPEIAEYEGPGGRITEYPRRYTGTTPDGEMRVFTPHWWDEACEITISGEAPQFGDWRFVANLTFDEGVFITRMVPGYSGPLVDAESVREGECDHCNIKRKRTLTYLCENVVTGERAQFGSACVKDVIGHLVQAAMFTDAELAKMREEIRSYVPETPVSFQMDELLVLACAAVGRWGWVSKAVAREIEKDSTTDRVMRHLFPPKFSKYYTREEYMENDMITPTEADEEMALAVLVWLDEQAGNSSEYMANLKRQSAASLVSARNAPLWISAAGSYKRSLETEAQREAWARERAEKQAAREVAALASAHVGEIKERRIFADLIVTKVHDPRESDWGWSYGYTFKDPSGNVIKYWSSRPMVHAPGKPWNDGDTVTLKATVKKHGEFTPTVRDASGDKVPGTPIKETIITRAVMA